MLDLLEIEVTIFGRYGRRSKLPRYRGFLKGQNFVKELLIQKHVLVVHGSGFGQKPGTNHIRIVFLPDEKILGKAYQSIAEFIQKRYS